MQCGDKSVLSLALVAIWTCLFCDYLLLTIAIPIFPTLAVCASSDVLTGVLFSSKAVMQIVFSPLVSCFVDRFALELLIGGMAVEGCATVVFTLTRSYPLWLIGRGTQGIASAAIITAAFAYLQRHYVDDKQRGVAMSVATTGIIGGVMLGPPIGGLLYGVWQPAPFVASMVLCAVAAVGVVVLRLQVKRQCCWRGLPVAGGNAASGSAIVRSDAADSDVPMTELAALESVGEGSDVANDGGGGGGGRRPTSFATAEEEGDVVSVTLAGESPLDAAAALAGTGDGGGGGDAKAESALRVALRIVSDRRMAAVLGAVWVANASISCLEANIGAYLQQDMGFSVSASGLTYIVTALPSVAASFVAGSIGNRCGRWQTVAGGLILQGLFYALSPKSNMWVECLSLVGLGVGMGLVDGVTPALLGAMSDEHFGGTGVIYAVNTATVQLGFMVGPVGGGALKQLFGFEIMSVALGLIVALYALVVVAVFCECRGCASRCGERVRLLKAVATGARRLASEEDTSAGGADHSAAAASHPLGSSDSEDVDGVELDEVVAAEDDAFGDAL